MYTIKLSYDLEIVIILKIYMFTLFMCFNSLKTDAFFMVVIGFVFKIVYILKLSSKVFHSPAICANDALATGFCFFLFVQR